MKSKKIFALIILTLLIAYPIYSAIVKTDYEDFEGRKQTALPKLTAHNFIGGEFSKEFEDYLNDHAAFKKELNSLKSLVSYGIGIREKNNIILTNNRLYQRALKNPRLLNFIKNSKARIIAIPYSLYYAEDLPLAIKIKNEKANYKKEYDDFIESIKDQEYIDMSTLLTIDDYYKSDHHLNENGIIKLAEALSLNSNFLPETKQEFTGGLSRKTGFPVKDEFLPQYQIELKNEIYKLNDEIRYCYDFESLNHADPNLIYMGGNFGKLSMDGYGNGKAVIIKDSFANPILPLFKDIYREIIVLDARFLDEKIENEIAKDADIYVIAGF